MECYYHQGSPAVGICKACDKGLCKDCFVDTGQGGACKDKCEEKVHAISKLIEFNMRNVELVKYKVQSTGKRKIAMFSAGVLFILLTLYQAFRGESIAFICFLFAAVFFIGVFYYIGRKSVSNPYCWLKKIER